MATTLESYAPFDTGPGADIREGTWRKFMRHMLESGVLANAVGEFEVFADSTGMQAKVKTGECWIRGHWGEGTTQKTMAIAAAHATLARRDRVILRCDFTLNRIEVDVKTGTAAASPVAPALVQNSSMWEIALAWVQVDATVSTIAATKVNDERLRVGAAGGSAEYYQLTPQPIATGVGSLTKVKFDTGSNTTADVVVSGTGNTDFTIKRAGVYAVSATVGFTSGSSTGALVFATIRDNVNSIRLATDNSTTIAGQDVALNPATTKHFDINDSISVSVLQNSGGSLNLANFEKTTRIAVTWISDA